MLDILFRFFKRVLVLVPGLVIAYVAGTDIYPVLDRKVPSWLAILAVYVLAAYVLIPSAMRLVRYVFKPSHVPLYCTTPDGFASDPVNIGIVGTRKDIARAMQAAGWYQSDKRTVRNMLKMGMALALRRPYPNAPFSNLYLFGRSQDIGFQLPIKSSPHHRHHVRFWATSATSDPRHVEHISFWERLHRPNLLQDEVLWVGAASRDVGFGIIRHNGQLTHMIHPDTDAERTIIVSHLKKAGVVRTVKSVTAGKPYRLRNRVLSGHFLADGKMSIITLELRKS